MSQRLAVPWSLGELGGVSLLTAWGIKWQHGWKNPHSTGPILDRSRSSSLTRLFSGFYHLTRNRHGGSQRLQQS